MQRAPMRQPSPSVTRAREPRAGADARAARRRRSARRSRRRRRCGAGLDHGQRADRRIGAIRAPGVDDRARVDAGAAAAACAPPTTASGARSRDRGRRVTIAAPRAAAASRIAGATITQPACVVRELRPVARVGEEGDRRRASRRRAAPMRSIAQRRRRRSVRRPVRRRSRAAATASVTADSLAALRRSAP